MRTTSFWVAAAVAAIGLSVGCRPAPGPDSAATDAARLEGVWQARPPAKGPGLGHVLFIRGGELIWHSFESNDGKAGIGIPFRCTFTLDPAASPKQITLMIPDERPETQLGIYNLDGDTLTVTFAMEGGERPTAFGPGADVIVFTRHPTAGVPELDPPPPPVIVEADRQWVGEVPDRAVRERLPAGPVTTAADFRTAWTALRGAEPVPAVDFAREFVLVRTFDDHPITDIQLAIAPGAGRKVTDRVGMSTARKVDGLAYGMAVFRRDLVDVAAGQIVAREKAQ